MEGVLGPKNKDDLRRQLLSEADKLQARGELPRLANVLGELSQLLPKSAAVHERLGRVLLAIGQFKKAEVALKRVLELTSSPAADFYQTLGYCLRQNHQFVPAAEALKKAIEQRGATPETLVLLFESLHFSGNEQEATKALNEAARLFDNSSIVQYSLSTHLYISGRYEESIKHAREAIRLGDHSKKAYTALCNACLAVGEIGSAYDALRSANPEKTLSVKLARLWLDNVVRFCGLQEAIAWHSRFDSENDDVGLYLLSCLFLQDGQVSAAKISLDKIQAVSRNNISVIELTARCDALAADWESAYAKANLIWDHTAKETMAGKRPKIQKRPPPLPSQINRILYMPIEVAAREFDSRFLIALRAAEKSIPVIIASSHLLSYAAPNVPAGVYFLKTMNHYDSLKVISLSDTGQRFAALDEEQLGSYGNDHELVIGTDPIITDAIDIVMANNDSHANALKRVFPELMEKVKVTGNPRIEMLCTSHSGSLTTEVEALKASHPECVLLCTNFGGFASTTLNYTRIAAVMLEALNRAPGTEWGKEVLQQGRDFSLSEARSLAVFIEFVPELSMAFPKTKFVIRTHPAENPSIWRNRFSNLANVEVVTEGSLQAWLKAVRAVIYFSGCMTGVEAKLARTPAIKVDVDPALRFPRLGLSAHINPSASGGSQLIDKLTQIFETGSVAGHNYEADDQLIRERLTLGEPLPSVRSASVLDEFFSSLSAKAVNQDVIPKLYDAFAKAANLERTLAAGDTLLDKKRLKVSLEHMRARLQENQRLNQEFHSLAVNQLAEGAFLVGPANLIGT